MPSKNSNNVLTPQKKALALINHYFQKEKKGDNNARDQARKEFPKFLIKTHDGSYTLKSDSFEGKPETMHTLQGAITESLEKFVKPSYLENKTDIKVLDICSGFGYNCAALIEYLNVESDINIKLSIDLVEISLETLAAGLIIPSPLSSHNIIKKAIENKLIQEEFARFKLEKTIIPENIEIHIHSKDAREMISSLKSNNYDAIFLDPFSPLKSPELYTVEFFKELKRLIKNDGVLATYTSAAPVRFALIEAGFYIGEGPRFGRKSGGTLASLSLNNIKKNLSDDEERMIALSDAGIPFRDPNLKDPDLRLKGTEILYNRSSERKKSRGNNRFSSAVRTPLFLGKDIKLDRKGRRVIKNVNDLGINDLKANEIKYIICNQFNSCICGCNEQRPSNSRDKILIMAQRLEKLVSIQYT